MWTVYMRSLHFHVEKKASRSLHGGFLSSSSTWYEVT